MCMLSFLMSRNVFRPINAREKIQKIKGIGPKTYQQSIGFLRIRNSDSVDNKLLLNDLNRLDSTAIHPESYSVARGMLKDLGLKAEHVGTSVIKKVCSVLKQRIVNYPNISFL